MNLQVGFWVSEIIKKYTFSEGSYISAKQVNINFDDLYKTVNGIIENYDSFPIGTILSYGGDSNIPSSWILCDGRELSRMEYPDLFGIIKTRFGEGDGNTTFNLPDIRGLFLRGQGKQGGLKKANNQVYDGGNVGTYTNDQFQGFGMKINANNGGVNNAGLFYYIHESGLEGYTTALFVDHGWYDYFKKYDNGNGEPREGDETRPANISVNYIIKIGMPTE